MFRKEMKTVEDIQSTIRGEWMWQLERVTERGADRNAAADQAYGFGQGVGNCLDEETFHKVFSPEFVAEWTTARLQILGY